MQPLPVFLDVTKIAHFWWKNIDVGRTLGVCQVIYIFFWIFFKLSITVLLHLCIIVVGYPTTISEQPGKSSSWIGLRYILRFYLQLKNCRKRLSYKNIEKVNFTLRCLITSVRLPKTTVMISWMHCKKY